MAEAASFAHPLPVYIEDNHAGTFQFLASVLDLDEPHLLVLVDSHSDASTPSQVDAIRDGLRRVATAEDKERRLVQWRRTGAVQSFDWIAPLMPAPIERVVWCAPQGGLPSAVPRRWIVAGPENLASKITADSPVVVSIDLDYFAGLGEGERERRFREVWRRIIALPRLSAIAFAISRPWLSDDAEASQLVLLSLSAALSIANAEVEFEPYGIEGPDRSERAKLFFRARQEPPRFDLEQTSAELRSLLLAHSDRLVVRLNADKWRDTLARWKTKGSIRRVSLDGVDVDSDGAVRPSSDSRPDLCLEGGDVGDIRQVTWLKWAPRRWSYDVLPDLPTGKVFVGTAPPVVEYEKSVLAKTRDGRLAAEIWRGALPGPGPSGVLRVSAEIQADRGTEHTAVLEIRQGAGEGFHDGLAEQFGLPYVFGAGFLRRGDLRGPDTGVGNDCANFLIAAWRRSGLRVPWCNPAQLRRHLTCLARNAAVAESLSIPEGAVDRGLVVHLGSHVAAVWEDRPPIGVLGGNDLVVHHLGGAPEIITLGDLLARRSDPTFDLYVAPERQSVAWIAVGGDLMPGPDGEPPSEIRQALSEADLAVANLETTVASDGRAAPKRYNFAIPEARLGVVQALGIGAVSLANNHAGDFGPVGLKTTIDALRLQGLAYFGAGAETSSAVQLWRTEVKGITVAFLGMSLSDTDLLPASETTSGVAALPQHAQQIADALAAVQPRVKCIIAMPHWGTEGSRTVTSEQQRWARWLVRHGADAVVGSGPHVVQTHEMVEGVPVFYSAGNLWFTGRWPAQARRAGIVLLGLDDQGRIAMSRLELRSGT